MAALRPLYTSKLYQPLRACRCHIPLSHFRYASYDASEQTYKDRSVQPSPKADRDTAPAPRSGDSAMIREEDSKEGMAAHQPDFRAPIDHGTSYVPRIAKEEHGS